MAKRYVMTVCYPLRQNAVLLGQQRLREGHRNLNAEQEFWNGPGGKVRDGEGILKANNREVKQECRLRMRYARRLGIVLITYEYEDFEVELHFLTGTEYSGMPDLTLEMKLWKWFPVDVPPLDEMWPNDQYTFSRFMDGERLLGYFRYKSRKHLEIIGDPVILSWGRKPLPQPRIITPAFFQTLSP